MVRACRDGLSDLVSYETGLDTGRDSRVQQHFGNEVDVNTIVRRFGLTRELPVVASDRASYGDFSSVGDFHSAMNSVVAGVEAFDRLPAVVRERFANDPGELWSWLHDPANDDEAVRLGLFKAKPEAKPGVTDADVGGGK